MSFLKAGIAVLRQERRAMTTREVAELAIDRGLITSSGKTPDATLAAQLYVRVRDDPDGPLRKLAEPGPTRSKRGSVRWEWRGD